MLLAGLCTVDLVQRVEELPAPGEKVQSLSVDVAAGGPATNAAVTVAALGGAPTLLTVLGAHPLADLARADLDACGVRVVDTHPTHPDPPSVSAVAVRDRDGERTVVSRNAGGQLAAELPPWGAQLQQLGGQLPRSVLLDGHHPELALGVAKWARKHGIPVVLDAGSWKPVLDELLPLVDIAACSAHFRVPGAGLHERGVPTVITTAGPGPVRWSTTTASGEVPAPPVDARDTLGAGDVWHGALAFGVGTLESLVANGDDLPDTGSPTDAEIPALIEFANAVASERVRHTGPRSWVVEIRERWAQETAAFVKKRAAR